MDDDDAYLDSLLGGRPLMLRGLVKTAMWLGAGILAWHRMISIINNPGSQLYQSRQAQFGSPVAATITAFVSCGLKGTDVCSVNFHLSLLLGLFG
jgi:hypothetical protein